jgi:hypothetical protein
MNFIQQKLRRNEVDLRRSRPSHLIPVDAHPTAGYASSLFLLTILDVLSHLVHRLHTNLSSSGTPHRIIP